VEVLFDGSFDRVTALGLAEALRPDPCLSVAPTDMAGTAGVSPHSFGAPVRILDDTGDLPVTRPALRKDGGIVLLTRKPPRPYGMLLLEAGVTCLASSASPEDIRYAVRLTAGGRNVFVSADGKHVERARDSEGRILTDREIEVLVLLSRGASYGTIALALTIGAGTVRKHTASLMEKLGARTRQDLTGLPVSWLQLKRRPRNCDCGSHLPLR
jgi:DNA-binding CsgD family transcriptional regulator